MLILWLFLIAFVAGGLEYIKTNRLAIFRAIIKLSNTKVRSKAKNLKHIEVNKPLASTSKQIILDSIDKSQHKGLNLRAMSKIEVNNIYKIFGPKPEQVLPMVKDGATKEQVMEETGHTVGLDNVSLSIEEGEIFVCMGLSGSGKSTLIRHINRLIDPTSGEVFVNKVDVCSLDEKEILDFRKKTMSMVFQRFGLFPHKTIIENVAYGLEIQEVPEDQRVEIAQGQINAVGLEGFEHQYPAQLSGGMQQRVGLARALATDPQILLMDEAFSALDPLIRSDMQNQLVDLQAKLKKTIVFITHDLDESLKLGDHIGILNGGRLVQVGRPEDIILNPADDYVKAFVKDVNRPKVLRARTIMTKLNKFDKSSVNPSSTYKYDEDTYIEDFLPKVLKDRSTIEVINKEGTTTGFISSNELSLALTKTK